MSTPFAKTIASLSADSSRRHTILFVVAMSLLTAWLIWFLGAQINVYEVTNQGRLEYKQSRYSVQAPIDGRVKVSHLKLGKEVKVGDILLELDAESERLQLGRMQAQGEALVAQSESLERVVAAEEEAMKTEMAEDRMAINESRARLQKDEILETYYNDLLKRQKKLFTDGATPEANLQKAVTDSEAFKTQSKISKISKARRGVAYLSRMTNRLSGIEKLKSEVTRLRGEIEVNKRSILELEYEIEKRQIRSPIAGKLAQIEELLPGSFLEAGDRIATILSQGDLIAVAFYEPSRAVGRIRSGQKAHVRLQGFPWTQYGELKGTVVETATETTSEGLIRVELTLDQDPSSGIPKEHGMPAEVRIEVESISPATLVVRTIGKRI